MACLLINTMLYCSTIFDVEFPISNDVTLLVLDFNDQELPNLDLSIHVKEGFCTGSRLAPCQIEPVESSSTLEPSTTLEPVKPTALHITTQLPTWAIIAIPIAAVTMILCILCCIFCRRGIRYIFGDGQEQAMQMTEFGMVETPTMADPFEDEEHLSDTTHVKKRLDFDDSSSEEEIWSATPRRESESPKRRSSSCPNPIAYNLRNRIVYKKNDD